MITWHEVRSMLQALLRWWWIIILAIALSSGTAFYISKDETRYYVARATLMVGNTFSSASPDQYQISIGGSLTRFYSELARREPILKPVETTLQLPFPWPIISDNMLATNVVPSANLIEITITDSNAERAAAIANTIGEQLTTYSPTSTDKIQAEKAAVQQQLTDTDQRIEDIKAKVADLTKQQQQMTSASDLAEVNNSLAELNHNLTQEQNTYTSLLNYKNNSVVNSLNFFERAAPPTQPLPSKRKITVGVAGLSGLLLSFLAIFLIEHFDTRWRSPKDIKDRLKLDNLGQIPIGPPLLITAPSFFEERFQAARDIQTNILLAAPASGARTLMLTSPQPSESRAAFSIDLADLFSRAGHKVLIVDAEFTRSFLTHMLTVPNSSHGWNVGLGNEHDDFWAYLRPTPIPNVALLPGRAETNGMPALIPSLRWRELVQRLMGIADVIIFDGPSTLSGPDAALLAPHVEGIVLTLDPATDSHEDVNESRARLMRHNGENLLGAVTFTPSKQHLYGRKALKTPDQPSAPFPETPATASTPQTPVINLRMFGREFRVVWGQPKPKRNKHGTENANPATPGMARAATAETEPAQEPIITPPPESDRPASIQGQWYDATQAYAMPDPPPQASAWQPGIVVPAAQAEPAQSVPDQTSDPSAHTPISTPTLAADETHREPSQTHAATNGRKPHKTTRSRASTQPRDKPGNI